MEPGSGGVNGSSSGGWALAVVEGHASAEGDYGQNLQLSQERAERISRELVRHGVGAERLMPVGYGEAEAAAASDAAEAERSLDRRVVVFRMK